MKVAFLILNNCLPIVKEKKFDTKFISAKVKVEYRELTEGQIEHNKINSDKQLHKDIKIT